MINSLIHSQDFATAFEVNDATESNFLAASTNQKSLKAGSRGSNRCIAATACEELAHMVKRLTSCGKQYNRYMRLEARHLTSRQCGGDNRLFPLAGRSTFFHVASCTVYRGLGDPDIGVGALDVDLFKAQSVQTGLFHFCVIAIVAHLSCAAKRKQKATHAPHWMHSVAI